MRVEIKKLFIGFAVAIGAAAASLHGDQAAAQGGAYSFGVVGDTPYTKAQTAEFSRVIASLNAADLRFVIHVGDFEFDPRPFNRDPSKADMPCTDENFAAVLASFQTSKHPFVLTPGDNDWTDCKHLKARKVDPLERLAKLRTMFYPDGMSLGREPMKVVSQASDSGFSKFRENLVWSVGPVTYVTVHTVGSEDNSKGNPEEYKERLAANIAWLKKAFAAAKSNGDLGLVIMTQANPQFENRWTRSYASRYARSVRGAEAPKEPESSPYDPFLDALIAEMQSFDKPVAYIHGDTHIFRVSKPLMNPKTKRFFENFNRVETFGWPDSNWVRVTVDPANPELFEFHAEVVKENSANYSR